jgi:hypothetical protein
MHVKVRKSSSGTELQKVDSQLSSKEVKISNKFKKYLIRMTQVIDGACKKIPNTPVRVNNHSLLIG